LRNVADVGVIIVGVPGVAGEALPECDRDLELSKGSTSFSFEGGVSRLIVTEPGESNRPESFELSWGE
jgi:hypothetical protein